MRRGRTTRWSPSRLKYLRNRLDQALVKFNQSLAQNKKLREDIDDLRRERVVFDSIYRKLRERARREEAPDGECD